MLSAYKRGGSCFVSIQSDCPLCQSCCSYLLVLNLLKLMKPSGWTMPSHFKQIICELWSNCLKCDVTVPRGHRGGPLLVWGGSDVFHVWDFLLRPLRLFTRSCRHSRLFWSAVRMLRGIKRSLSCDMEQETGMFSREEFQAIIKRKLNWKLQQHFPNIKVINNGGKMIYVGPRQKIEDGMEWIKMSLEGDQQLPR